MVACGGSQKGISCAFFYVLCIGLTGCSCGGGGSVGSSRGQDEVIIQSTRLRGSDQVVLVDVMCSGCR